MKVIIKKSGKLTTTQDSNLNPLYREIMQYGPMTKAEERELIQLAQDGSESAKRKIARHNLRFIIFVAKKYQNKGVLLNDLISQGSLGLMEAIGRFDLSKDTKFITYAVQWIRKYILEAFFNVPLVKRPANQALLAIQVEKAYSRLYNQLEREPEVYEVAEMLSCTEKQVKEVMNYLEKHQSIFDEDGKENDELLAEWAEENDESFRAATVHGAIAKLDDLERQVVIRKFGLSGHKEHSLEEIAKSLDIPVSRVKVAIEESLVYMRDLRMIEALLN